MGDDLSIATNDGTLTQKQRDVLELLIRHKTSKEIARILSISPYTVDQRITAARKKLGVGSRNELAEAYRQLTDISQELAYQFPYMENKQVRRDQGTGATSESVTPANHPIPINRDRALVGVMEYRVVPEIFEGRSGIWIRLLAIGLIAIMLLVIVLGGLAAFGQLSDLLS